VPAVVALVAESALVAVVALVAESALVAVVAVVARRHCLRGSRTAPSQAS
jgi:hypothetical protein